MESNYTEYLERKKRKAYLDWIKVYCRNDFIVDGVEQVPLVIGLIIDEMISHDNKPIDASSESLGDYSVTHNVSDEGYPKITMAKLKPFIKVRFV